MLIATLPRTPHRWGYSPPVLCVSQAAEQKAVGESRAMRRRPGRLRAAAEASCAQDLRARSPEAAPRRLETHVWHAKRFAMHVKCACGLHSALIAVLPKVCFRSSPNRPMVGLRWRVSFTI